MYQHRQVGTVVLIAIGGSALLCGLAVAVWAPLGGLLVASALGVLGFLFWSLSVSIVGSELRLWFGPGLIRRKLDLEHVVAAEAVRNHWFYGWGIRLVPSGWLWNVSGLDAVQVTYRDGKKFRIGTDEPAELLDAIRLGAGLKG